MGARSKKPVSGSTVKISVSREDLAALTSRAKDFRNGSSTTTLLEMAEAHRRERAMNALLVVLAKAGRSAAEVEEHAEERKRISRQKLPTAKRQTERQSRKHTRWSDD